MAFVAFQRGILAGGAPDLTTLILNKARSRSAFLQLLIPGPLPIDLNNPSNVMASETEEIERRASSVANHVCGSMAIVAAAGQQLHFKTIFALQPTLFSKETPSREEQTILGKTEIYIPALVPAFSRTYFAINNVFEHQNACGTTYLDLRRAVQTEKPVYLDLAHMSPRGNDIVAAKLALVIGALP